MDRLVKRLNKKSNNKGFTLVELIIVIAIVAALIAILAPQYIKYVEKSRISADDTFADELKKAVQVIVTDEDYVIGNGFTVAWSNGAVAVTGSGSTAAADKAVVEGALSGIMSANYATQAIKSKKYAVAATDVYTITVAYTAGVPTVTAVWG